MAESVNVRVPLNSKTMPYPNRLTGLDYFRRSAPPSRFLYYASNGSWRDFSGEVLCHVKTAFLEGKPIVDVSVSDSRFLFDLIRMVQIDFDSGNQRSIAWIDDSGKCFFPKVFINEEFDDVVGDYYNKNIEIELRIGSGNNCVKRKRENKEEEEVSSFRKQNEEEEQKRQRLRGETTRWGNARVLSENEKGYSTIRDQFLLGMKKVDCNVVISAISRCSEKLHHDAFSKQVRMMEAVRGAPNVVYAWYGASVNSMESVSEHTFRVDSSASAAECYGVGVYLSPLGLPHVSANLAEVDGNGERHIIFCRVILGNVEKVKAGSQQYCSSSVDFDTGSDNPRNPKWYIVWSDCMVRHIFPEFVVSFKTYNPVQGQMGGLTRTKYTIEKLFSKIRSMLSASKIREVSTLYEGFRSGKMVKDVFIKQLRWIVGDKVLLSAIREIRGSD